MLEATEALIGLTINESKTKYMEVTNTPTNITHLEVNRHMLKKVKQFKYLGTPITCDNKKNIEINHRVIRANRSYWIKNTIKIISP
jgi:hypothetical protein